MEPGTRSLRGSLEIWLRVLESGNSCYYPQISTYGNQQVICFENEVLGIIMKVNRLDYIQAG